MERRVTTSKFKKYAPIAIVILALILLVYFLSSIYSAEDYFNGESNSIAEDLNTTSANAVSKYTDANIKKITTISNNLSGLTSPESIDSVGNKYTSDKSIDCLKFINKSGTYSSYGDYVSSSNSSEVSALITTQKLGFTNVYQDASIGEKCLVVYSPVNSPGLITGVVAYYTINSLISDLDLISETFSGVSIFTCIAMTDGLILKKNPSGVFKESNINNVLTYIHNLTASKSSINSIEKGINNGNSGATAITVDGIEYDVAYCMIPKFGNNVILFNIYNSNTLLKDNFSLYNRLIGSSVLLAILVVIAMLFALLTRFRYLKQETAIETTDPLLGCNSFSKFKIDAEELLQTNKYTQFAMVYFNINRYDYLKEHFTAQACDNTMRFLANVISKCITKNETYGHVIDDCFVAFLHYTKIEELSDRIKIITAIVNNYDSLKSKNFKLSLNIGIFCIDLPNKLSLQEMLDRAIVAQKANEKSFKDSYIIYNDKIRADFLRESEIEATMEQALVNNDFKVFLQPKYNIVEDRIGGAEALVRWYDPSKQAYEPPDNFIPLFEVNGFISTLDRYVFTKVCEYFSEAISRGEKVTPVSVNVSRVTAAQPDFLKYYLKQKSDYKVADGFLIIEFTESFAFENYDSMKMIVAVLKNNGFGTSIDDFGSGYSSYNILKELPMDELKLDKFFINKGVNPEKDKTLLKMIIKTGKELGLHVTQEGVEKVEELEMLKEFGCDTIQGFFYSRPLIMSDFISFVNRDTSLKAVRILVKD